MTREEAKTVFLNRGYIELDGGSYFDGNKWRESIVVISEWLKEEPCEDAVSREAVINAFPDILIVGYNHTGIAEYNHACIVKIVKSLPSVTPKPTECEDAVNIHDVIERVWEKLSDGYAEKAHTSLDVRDWFSDLPPVTPKQKWIPVSERLPEKTGLYLVSIGDLVTTGSFDGHDFRTQTMVRFVPDAWMPLPEPYKEGESE